ncbi:hypothetical protein Q2468_27585, partial [Escherichia coli]|nr:hypothetical protein [Escherichia coli]
LGRTRIRNRATSTRNGYQRSHLTDSLCQLLSNIGFRADMLSGEVMPLSENLLLQLDQLGGRMPGIIFR